MDSSIKIIFLSSLTFFCIDSLGQKLYKKEIKVIEATASNWSPGTMRQDSPPKGGRLYTFKAVITSKQPVKPIAIAKDKIQLPVEVIKKAERNFKGLCARGDTLMIIARQDLGEHYDPVSTKLAKTVSKMGSVFLIYQVDGRDHVTELPPAKETTSTHLNR